MAAYPALGPWAAAAASLVAAFAVALWLARSLSALAAAESLGLRQSAKDLVERLGPGDRATVDDAAALGSSLSRVGGEMALALARLADEKDRLEGILETMVEGVLVTDDVGQIVVANRALRALGASSDSPVGKRPIEVIRHSELAELLARVLAEGTPLAGEIDLGGLDARRVRVRAAPLRQPEARGVVAVLDDVTELRRLEKMRREFVANVSHELRTPIAAIRAAAETLEGGALDDDVASVEFVGVIARHAARLHELVEDLLDLSRLDARRLELAFAPVPVAEALDAAVSLHALAAERRKIALARGPVDPALVVHADRRALERILSNLIENAVKYSRPGDSVTLGVERAAGGLVRLAVCDTGPGIEARHLPRLFERFYRADKGRTRDHGGTGLGLAIAKHLAEAMGGSLEVTSEIGKGSRFFVSLGQTATDSPPGVGEAA